MLGQATDYNDTTGIVEGDASISAYDRCNYLIPVSGTNLVVDPAAAIESIGEAINDGSTLYQDDVNTKWSIILKFNTFLWMGCLIMNSLALIGAFLKPLYHLSSLLCCCQMCAMFACVITTAVFRFGADSKACATNDSLIEEGVTFKDHGDKLLALFIAEAVLLCVYQICSCCQVNTSGLLSGAKKPVEQ